MIFRIHYTILTTSWKASNETGLAYLCFFLSVFLSSMVAYCIINNAQAFTHTVPSICNDLPSSSEFYTFCNSWLLPLSDVLSTRAWKEEPHLYHSFALVPATITLWNHVCFPLRSASLMWMEALGGGGSSLASLSTTHHRKVNLSGDQ